MTRPSTQQRPSHDAAAPRRDTTETPRRADRFCAWLIPNLLACFVCMPLAAAGLFYGYAALSARRHGELDLARRHARSARAFFWFAIVLGSMTALFYLCQPPLATP